MLLKLVPGNLMSSPRTWPIAYGPYFIKEGKFVLSSPVISANNKKLFHHGEREKKDDFSCLVLLTAVVLTMRLE